MLALAAPVLAQGRSMSAPSLPDNSPLLAGIPSGTLTSEPVMLSIGDVVRRALEHNLGLNTSEARVAQLNGERRVSMSEVLPNLSARLSEVRQRTSLEARGPGYFRPSRCLTAGHSRLMVRNAARS